MTMHDPRLTPFRADLAADFLQDTISAPRYAKGRAMEVAVPILPLTRAADVEAALDHQLLLGQAFTLYDSDPDTGLAWGQAADGYVGYVPQAGLEPVGTTPTHKVSAKLTHLYPEPNMKSRPMEVLPFGAALRGADLVDGFWELDLGGFVPAQHLQSIDQVAQDPAGIATMFLGAPYLWGGNSALGVDCSGLVQLALAACGHDCPRDSDMQQSLGQALADGAAPERNDLVFWKGHVGIMLNARTLLHANAHHMAVAQESLAAASKRICNSGGGEWPEIRRIS